MSWAHTLERALALTDARAAIRLTNLALTAVAASGDRRVDGVSLEKLVRSLVVSGPLETRDNVLDWQALADEAASAFRAFRGAGGHDRWVQAFQNADPGRKSRGAYATPVELARPMAKLILRGDRPRRILDPSAGGGALLLACFRVLATTRPSPEIASDVVRRLYGVELDPVARELCCLQLWLACGRVVDIGEIASRVQVDNAITRDWEADAPYDAVIMNPPWDSLRHGDDIDEPERWRTIDRLRQTVRGQGSLPHLFSQQGRGDRNLYKAFVELVPHLVREQGRIVALLPGAWSSDLGTRHLRDLYLEATQIEQWTSLENRRGYFPIDGRYKFGILAARRDPRGTRTLQTLGMADDISQLASKHVSLSVDALDEVGGPARILPDLTSAREARLLRKIRANGIPFFEEHEQLGRVRYDREVDLTEDRKRGLFDRLENLQVARVRHDTWIDPAGRELRPLIEGRMVGQYEFFEKSWVSGQGRRAAWTYSNGHGLADCQPQFLAAPTQAARSRLAICDVTSATNTRTVLAAWVPSDWPCGNTAPVLAFDNDRRALAALAILNSMVFDWQARRIVSGLHLNKFYLQAMSWPNLAEGAVDELVAAATVLLNLSPRFRDAAPLRLLVDIPSTDHIAAHVTIERTVAAGYRLTRDDCEQLYTAVGSDRRGLWRHYASDPSAQVIAGSVIADAFEAHEPRADLDAAR